MATAMVGPPGWASWTGTKDDEDGRFVATEEAAEEGAAARVVAEARREGRVLAADRRGVSAGGGGGRRARWRGRRTVARVRVQDRLDNARLADMEARRLVLARRGRRRAGVVCRATWVSGCAREPGELVGRTVKETAAAPLAKVAVVAAGGGVLAAIAAEEPALARQCVARPADALDRLGRVKVIGRGVAIERVERRGRERRAERVADGGAAEG